MMRRVICPVLPLWRDASCERRMRELLFGEAFAVQQKHGDFGFGRAQKVGYSGFVRLDGLGAPDEPTHVVASRATHMYPAPDIKSPPQTGLSFGSRLCVIGRDGSFLKTIDGGYVPADHMRGIKKPMQDPAEVAEIFLGTPYLWGGNSCWGIDCSGLVQAALLACGLDCAADTSQQRDAVGRRLGDGEAIARGDLLFWQGHVGMALDGRRLIHATGFHMAVVEEGIQEITDRIADQGLGPVLARRRP